MIRTNQPKLKLLTIAISTLLCVDVYGAGFQLNAQSATGLGRAFAGDAAIADNASAIARNPATAAFFKQNQFSLGLTLIDSDVSLVDPIYTNISGDTTSLEDATDLGGLSPVPNGFAVWRLNDTWSIGAGVYSNFGTGTEFEDTFAGNEFAGLTEVKSINGQLSVAYRINDRLSLGVGADIVHGAGKLKKFLNPSKTIVLDADTSGIGFGFHGGLLFELNDDHRFGLSYRQSPKLETKGTITKRGASSVTLEDESLFVPLPDLIEFSGFHQLNSTWATHYSFQYITWSKFDKLETKNFTDNTLKEYNWQDTWHLAVGLTYQVNNNWQLRSGYMYDQQAVDKIRSIAIPDSNRQWFSFGVGYQQQQHQVDFGFTYLIGDDVEVEENFPLGSSIKGTTKASAILAAIQYSYRF